MHVRVALVACTIGLLLSGSSCSNGEPYGTLPPTTPTASPPATTKPTPTPSPTPPAPTPPALATQDSAPGAEAFARFYLVAQDYANRTGRTALLRSLGTCKGCDAVAAGIEGFYAAGGQVEGGEVSVLSSTVIKHVRSISALVAVTYTQAEGRQIRKNGNITVVPATGHNGVLLTLRRDRSEWQVANVQTTK